LKLLYYTTALPCCAQLQHVETSSTSPLFQASQTCDITEETITDSSIVAAAALAIIAAAISVTIDEATKCF
jgi:hypothetical protein